MKIQVVDVCDNVPYFVNRLYMVRVSENTRPGTVIMKVTAEDMDEGKVIYIKIFCSITFSSANHVISRDLEIMFCDYAIEH